MTMEERRKAASEKLSSIKTRLEGTEEENAILRKAGKRVRGLSKAMKAMKAKAAMKAMKGKR